MTTKIVLIMGVSGSGKSTVGQALAGEMNVKFYDGDDFHPAENVEKMSNGQPLTDTDRLPWLQRLHDLLRECIADNTGAVVACSALKQSYRDILMGNLNNVHLVYLHGDFDMIWQRMQERDNHYMKASMLRSQFDTLEPPSEDLAQVISIDKPIRLIVEEIIECIL